MNNISYYILRGKKTASVNKLKKTFTAEIREFCNEMDGFVESNPHMSKELATRTIYDMSSRAHGLANFAYYNLCIYTSSEWDYIKAKIFQAMNNAVDEVLRND